MAFAEAMDIVVSEARTRLLELCPPGTKVYCILRHVSSSGMSRRISALVWKDNEPVFLDGMIENLGVFGTRHGKEGLVVSGCGMDMGFHVVYELSSALYPDGFTCAGKHCPSNDHTNGDRSYRPHKHSSGGYALRKEWL